jgi:hypothetical protein
VLSVDTKGSKNSKFSSNITEILTTTDL